MNKKELEVMIILIEGEYDRNERNTPFKMKNLIKKEFDINVTELNILMVCGIEENYELESKMIQYGYNKIGYQ